MNILITSYFFLPSIGGIEILTNNLATEFVKLGNNVTVVTNTIEEYNDTLNYKIIRRPSRPKLIKLYSWADIVIQQNISLNFLWPKLLFPTKKIIIVHHQANVKRNTIYNIKRFIYLRLHNICVSKTVKDTNNIKSSTIILNPYNSYIYKNNLSTDKRNDNFVFVGRLCREKGVFLLIDAFNEYKENYNINKEKLLIIGDGQQASMLKEYANTKKYKNDIIFLGNKSQENISEILNQSKFLILPSITTEAFGIVVLEGLACGCFVIGSDGDGIAEALNGFGLLFKKNDYKSLAETMGKAVLNSDTFFIENKSKLESYLSSRNILNVAKEYLDYINNIRHDNK